VSDIFDHASTIEEMQRQHAIDRQRAYSKGPDVRLEQCIDCGETIDPQRRRAVRNCRRCIECEKAAESLMQASQKSIR